MSLNLDPIPLMGKRSIRQKVQKYYWGNYEGLRVLIAPIRIVQRALTWRSRTFQQTWLLLTGLYYDLDGTKPIFDFQ